MHLPPLDVAVYPISTMSHGRPTSRVELPPSSASHPSAASSSRTSASPDFSRLQKAIRTIFRSSRVTVQRIERFRSRLHQVYLVRLVEGSPVVLKCPPTFNTRMLRHEQNGLETEFRILNQFQTLPQLPVPRIINYDPEGDSLGAPFLMTTHVPGRSLSEMAPYLSQRERHSIDRTLGAYFRQLSSLRASQYGLTHRVYSSRGAACWREAFLSLLESILRDAEDMMINVHYESIRGYIGKHSHFLDEVTTPYLVPMDACDPRKVLIDERTKQVSGLVGFSSVVWGDPLLSRALANPSAAFMEGYGSISAQTGGVRARKLM